MPFTGEQNVPLIFPGPSPGISQGGGPVPLYQKGKKEGTSFFPRGLSPRNCSPLGVPVFPGFTRHPGPPTGGPTKAPKKKAPNLQRPRVSGEIINTRISPFCPCGKGATTTIHPLTGPDRPGPALTTPRSFLEPEASSQLALRTPPGPHGSTAGSQWNPSSTSSLQSSRLKICYYPEICTRGGSTRARALGFSAHRGDPPTRRSIITHARTPLPRRSGIGPTLQRHPFSGLVDSAGELLHTP